MRAGRALHWYWYWYFCGHNREGREWLGRVLTADPPPSPPARARALAGGGLLAWSLGEYRQADRWLSEAVPLLRECGDAEALGAALHYLGHVLDVHGRPQDALAAFEESMAICEAAGDRWGAAFSMNCSGLALAGLGTLAQAAERMEEAHREYQRIGDRRLLAWGRANLGTVLSSHDDPRAILHAIETAGGGVTFSAGAPLKRRQRLRAAADQVRRALGDGFDAASAEGAAADLADIVEEALAVEGTPAVEPRPAPGAAEDRAAGDRADGGPLSPREREVAALIARGLSNREIARALLIGHRTVATHVQSILNKLGADRRSQIAAQAVAHGLHSPAS